MRRRTILRTTGSVTLFGLAGCSSDGGDESTTDTATDGTPTPTATPTPTPTESTADHLDTAATEMDRALTAFSEESDALSRAMDEQVSIDVDRITEHLNAAERALDAAAVSDPTDEQQASIDALRSLIASFRDVTTSIEAMAVAFDDLRVGLDQFERQEFDRAASSFEGAVGSFERASGAIEDAIADAEQIQSDATDAGVEEYRTALSDLAVLNDAGRTLAEGTRLLSLAFEQFLSAATAYDEGEYAAAVDPFAAATDYADQAAGVYGAPSEAPADVTESMASLECNAQNLRDAADHFRQAAEAGADGNTQQRQEHEQQGQAALDRSCDGGSGRVAAVTDAALAAVTG